MMTETLVSTDWLEQHLDDDDLRLIEISSTVDDAAYHQGGHIPGATHAFLGELREKLDELDRSATYATYCASGFRASIASSLLAARGFSNIRNVPGSWKAWTAAGYPTETPEHQ